MSLDIGQLFYIIIWTPRPITLPLAAHALHGVMSSTGLHAGTALQSLELIGDREHPQQIAMYMYTFPLRADSDKQEHLAHQLKGYNSSWK